MDSPTSPNISKEIDLIDDTNELISSVYDMLGGIRRRYTASPVHSPPERTSVNNSSSSGIDETTPSPSVPPLVDSAVPNRNFQVLTSTPTIHRPLPAAVVLPRKNELDAEISRVENFCETLEQNLRSTPMLRNPEAAVTLDEVSESLTVTSTLNVIGERDAGRSRPQGIVQPLQPVAIIDLCDSLNDSHPNDHTSPPVPLPLPAQRESDYSDDVVIVAEGDLIDLRSPLFLRRNIRSAINPVIRTDHARRRHERWQQRFEEVGNRHSASMTNIQSNHDQKNNSQDCVANSGAAVDTEPRTLMCAVCMENPLNKTPTSTKCGHVFCSVCINESIRINRKCPMCNTKLTPRMLFRLYV